MTTDDGMDFFARARLIAVTFLIAAGAVCVIGSALDWAVMDRCPEVLPGSSFEEADIGEQAPCPVRGIDAAEGWVAVAAGFLMMLGGTLLVVRSNPTFGWLGLAGAVVAGSTAISAYRGIGDAESSISLRLGLIEAYEPGIGLLVVAAAAIAGVIASTAGVAATPRSEAAS